MIWEGLAVALPAAFARYRYEGLGHISSRVGGGVIWVNEVDLATFESDFNVLQRLRQIDLTCECALERAGIAMRVNQCELYNGVLRVSVCLKIGSFRFRKGNTSNILSIAASEEGCGKERKGNVAETHHGAPRD